MKTIMFPIRKRKFKLLRPRSRNQAFSAFDGSGFKYALLHLYLFVLQHEQIDIKRYIPLKRQ